MSLLPANLVGIDCETSGLEPTRHGLLSIGAQTAGGESFYREVILEDGAETDAQALAVNGFGTRPTSEHAVPEDQALAELFDWLEARRAKPGTKWVAVGRNPSFDWAFLEAAARRHLMLERLHALVSRRTLDTHSVAYALGLLYGVDMTAPDFSTQQIYDRVNVPEEPRPHHALGGARIALHGLSALLSHLILSLSCNE